MMLLLFVTSCSNNDEAIPPYPAEQQTTLNVLHGSFISGPNAIGTTTTFTFKETYLDGPKTIIGKNIYGETKDITIHGLCEYQYNFVNNPTNDKYERALYIAPNGIDMKLYSLNSDKTISLSSGTEKYKVIVVNDNEIKLTSLDFPLANNTYNRIN